MPRLGLGASMQFVVGTSFKSAFVYIGQRFSIPSLTIWLVTGQDGAQWFQNMLSIALKEGSCLIPLLLEHSHEPIQIEWVDLTSVQHCCLRRTWIGHDFKFQVPPEYFIYHPMRSKFLD